MKVETMGRVLIVIGAVVMLYAQLAMPIALPGAEVVNIHLISERQNTLIMGGLLFFAGIVLFAVFKMKQTKEDELAQAKEAEQTRQAIKQTVEAKAGSTRALLAKAWAFILDVDGQKVSPKHDHPFARFINALVVTLSVGLGNPITMLLGMFFLVVPVGVFWIAFRPKPAFSPILILHTLNFASAILGCLLWFIIEKFFEESSGMRGTLSGLKNILYCSLVSLPFVLHALWMRKNYFNEK